MKKKNKSEGGILTNTFYMLRLMFSVSPKLVIGELVEQIIAELPPRLVSVIGIKYVIDKVQLGADMKSIVVALIAIAGILLFRDFYSTIFYEIFVFREREMLSLGINARLYEKATEIALAKYDDPSYYSDFILAIQSSSENITDMLRNIKGYVGEIVSLVSIGAIMLTIDPVCLVIVFAFVFGFLPLGKYLGKLMMKRREEVSEKERKSDYFARVFYLQEYAGEIKMSGIRPLLLKRFNESVKETLKTEKRVLKKFEALFFCQEVGITIIGFMFVLTGYLGYQALVKKTLGAGDFIATYNAAIQIANSITYLTVYAVRRFTEQSKMIEKYRKFLNCDSVIPNGEHVAECREPETITIENASFSYEGSDRDALEGLSLQIKPYEKIALVGYNGAGKTTLTNLLLRLYDVKSGSIKIGQRDIREETVASHRSRFAAVFQDFQIFAATVAENVALDKEFDEERVLWALKAAGFNKELPNGVNTMLLREFDDDGLMLSGGEQQKIAIARAFYKKCPYVILDEPSANLDPISEYELNRAMMQAASEKTVIFISHRLSTTRHADRILMMENGKIIESGNHDELMQLDGKYAEMFKLQAEKYTESV